MLTIIGDDRAGLVEALAAAVTDSGGTWQDSQMTELAGMFAGMVLVRVPEDRSEAFHDALEPLRERGLMDVTVRSAQGDEDADRTPAVTFDVVGTDRPGIVHEVSARLASLDVGIVDLRTWTESAAMAGGPLFKARAVLRLPAGTTTGDVRAALEELSDDLMVDLREG